MAKAERIIAASRRRDAAQGIVPSQGIARMIASGQIVLAEPAAETQVQPASLDLRLGPVAYRVWASFLPKPGGRVQSKLDDLAKLKGADFDKAYIDNQVSAHEDALSLMKNYADNGDTPSLKAAAGEIAPVVQKHLDMAKALKK